MIRRARCNQNRSHPQIRLNCSGCRAFSGVNRLPYYRPISGSLAVAQRECNLWRPGVAWCGEVLASFEIPDSPFGHGSFSAEILEEYVSNYRDPARVHGICEEYRGAATIHVEHDRADKEASKRIECPIASSDRPS